MSNVIQLEPIETALEDVGTDNHGMGAEYYRRKPYQVEFRSFDDNVKKQFPHRDAVMEDYLVDRAQTHQMGRVDNPPSSRGAKLLPKPHWGRRHDKIKHYIYEPQAAKELGITLRDGRSANPYEASAAYFNRRESAPTIDIYTGDESSSVHEGMHYLTDPSPGFPDFEYSDPRKAIRMPNFKGSPGSWGTRASEIMSEAADAKRRYTHSTVGNRVDMTQTPEIRAHDGGKSSRQVYKMDYGVDLFDKNHPAVKEGRSIPDEIIDDMFEQWMDGDRQGWGDSYRSQPEKFPVDVFKEALRLGKNTRKPGLFTGRGPQNA